MEPVDRPLTEKEIEEILYELENEIYRKSKKEGDSV